jgi:MFS transporter, BCD family, chlorophyll transporter
MTAQRVAATAPLGWFGILRLGLVQTALGAVVVVVTSTLNRVMVVEYALPAVVPGALVALHYAVQMIRPRFGFGSDRGGRRTPWVIGGMAVLALGGCVCAIATVWMAAHPIAGLALAVAGYSLVGLGVGAAGTSLLVLLSTQVAPRRRAAAASIMWILMIAGFAVTSTIVGHFLDPFSPRRLLQVTGVAAAIAFVAAFAAVWKVETPEVGRAEAGYAMAPAQARRDSHASFATALRNVWAEPRARSFTLFVFASMLAYSAEELLLEPFCGLVFHYSLGESARISGLWHAGVFVGMVCVGALCSGGRFGSLRAWTIGGCCASALAVLSLACAGVVGPGWPLRPCVAALGMANGVFAVAAIGSMMELANESAAGGAGVRMGLWGAAQAIAFAIGGVLGTGAVDVLRHLTGSASAAFSMVFGVEAVLFLVAARFAGRVGAASQRRAAANPTAVIA